VTVCRFFSWNEIIEGIGREGGRGKYFHYTFEGDLTPLQFVKTEEGEDQRGGSLYGAQSH